MRHYSIEHRHFNEPYIVNNGEVVAAVGMQRPKELARLIELANLGIKYEEQLQREKEAEAEMIRTKMERYTTKEANHEQET